MTELMIEITIARRGLRGQEPRVPALRAIAFFAAAAILRAVTLAEFVSLKFEPHVIARREHGGQKHYRFWWRKHVQPAVGAIELAELGPEQVEDLIAAKLAAGLSRQSLHHIKFVLSAIFRHAIHLRLYPHANPAQGVELYYDIADVERLRAVPERILARLNQIGGLACVA